jgi:hypothetical protein
MRQSLHLAPLFDEDSTEMVMSIGEIRFQAQCVHQGVLGVG